MTTTLAFNKCDRIKCQTIIIVNSLTVEKRESFRVTLGRTPGMNSRISINPEQADVIINDDDGMYHNTPEYCYIH